MLDAGYGLLDAGYWMHRLRKNSPASIVQAQPFMDLKL
jgi:hypothetical protein